MIIWNLHFDGLIYILFSYTLLWIISLPLKNASIVNIFRGLGFVWLNAFYFIEAGDYTARKMIVLFLVTIWGLRLSIHIFARNSRKGENFRHQNFRMKYGKKRYWWVSYFQVFLLQGILVGLISAPLLAVHYYSVGNDLQIFDYLAIFVWLIGFVFEAGGDFQLTTFKDDLKNKGKILQSSFWKYKRHPNYFGDAAVW